MEPGFDIGVHTGIYGLIETCAKEIVVAAMEGRDSDIPIQDLL